MNVSIGTDRGGGRIVTEVNAAVAADHLLCRLAVAATRAASAGALPTTAR